MLSSVVGLRCTNNSCKAEYHRECLHWKGRGATPVGLCIIASPCGHDFDMTTGTLYFLALADHNGYISPLDLPDRCALLKRVFALKCKKFCFNTQAVVQILMKSHLLDSWQCLHTDSISDPKIMAWLLEPELDSYELHSLLKKYNLQEERNDSETEGRSEVNDKEHVLQQAKINLNRSLRLANHLQLHLHSELLDVLRKEMKISVVLAKLECDGIGLDVNYLESKRGLLQMRMYSLMEQSETLLGHPVNLASPQQLAAVLFDELKLQVKQVTTSQTSKESEDKKYCTTNEATLLQLIQLHPLPSKILEYRQILKIRSTWIDGLVEKALPDKEGMLRLHSNWNATNTATGRLSSSAPNLQNIPRYALQGLPPEMGTMISAVSTESVEIVIRDAFVATKGYTLVSADYSQIELRVVAHLSSDPHLIEILLQAGDNGDIFCLVAAHFLGKATGSITCEERQQVKRLCYGILYGQGTQALCKTLGAGPDKVQRLMQSFLDHFPLMRTFVNLVKTKARQSGYVQTLWGRKRPLPEIFSKDFAKRAKAERQAVNTTVQGTAADIMKMAMLSIFEMMTTDNVAIRLLLQIHDELIFEVPDYDLPAATRRIRQCMENVAALQVPLPVNIQCGKRWGSMSVRPDV